MQGNEKKSESAGFSGGENPQNNENQQKINDNRSPIMVGYMWATNVTSAAVEMVIPIVGGVWLDNKFQTKPLFILIGLFLGMTIMLLHLLKFAKTGEEN